MKQNEGMQSHPSASIHQSNKVIDASKNNSKNNVPEDDAGAVVVNNYSSEL